MAVDKDLLFPGNKEYASDKCSIIPQTLNTMLSNCKKHKLPKWKVARMDLPLGVRYDSSIRLLTMIDFKLDMEESITHINRDNQLLREINGKRMHLELEKEFETNLLDY